MASEVKKVWFGSASVPVPPAGSSADVTTGVDLGSVTVTVNFDETAADTQAAFEAVPAIGAGNILVADILDGSSNRIGLQFTFQGALANTNIADWTVVSSLIQAADTITVTNTQDGAADQAVTPTLTVANVAAVALVTGVKEQQTISFDRVPASGSWTINGILVEGGADSAGPNVEAAILDAGGANKVVISSGGAGGPYAMTYQVEEPIADDYLVVDTSLLLDSDDVPVVATVTKITDGVTPIAGVSQQDTITSDHVPTVGSYRLHYDDLGTDSVRVIQFNDTATVIQTTINDLLAARGKSFTVTVSGISATSIVITWSDYADHTDVSNTAGTFTPIDGTNNTNPMFGELPLLVQGQPQSISIRLVDGPDAGLWNITKTGGSTSSDIAFDCDSTAVQDAIDSIASVLWGVSGSTGFFTATSTVNQADETFTGAEGATPLTKALGAEVVTTTQGSPLPPTAPSGLSATANGQNQIDLAWTDNSSNETGFQVERSANGTTGWTLITTTAADAVSYSNTGLTAGTKYYYRIRAVNTGGNSSYTNTSNATTDASSLTAIISTATLGVGVSL